VIAYRPALDRRDGQAHIARACLLFLIVALGHAAIATAAPTIDLRPIATGLPRPTGITHAGDGSGRLFISLQGGKIVVHDGTHVLPTPFLDVSAIVSCCGERGLLGLAFHPQYATNGFFYVDYTNTSGDLVLARYAVSSDTNLAQTSGTILLTIPKPFANHNGGQLAFGPDGYLYIGVGDGGGAGDLANNAQNLGSLLGKILRIDVDGAAPYAIPAANPFVGVPGARPEIWAFGVRNPWRFSFDRVTGDLFIGDVGQNAWEEVDFQPAKSPGGENYGWRRMEGTHCFNPTTDCNDGTLTLPIIEYPHAGNPPDCSITGGYRYRGNAIPELTNYYVFGDLCSGRILGAAPSGATWSVSQVLDAPFQISTFGEDQVGELYVAAYSETDGAVYRITGVGRSLRDFDGDGTTDILWRDTAGNVAMWLMDGTVIRSNNFVASVPTAWTPVGIADFDGDRRADILWRDTSGNLAIWLMNGNVIDSNLFIGNVPPPWIPVGVGDFNGDGKADILWRDASGNLAIWLMNGANVRSNTFIGSVASGWTFVGLGDFDGDGNADILWRDTSGNLAMWRMDGDTILSNTLFANVATGWTSVGFGDFDGDRRTDILWRDTSGNLAIWLMDGTVILRNTFVGNVPVVWTPVKVGDFDGDGMADILWRDTFGHLAMWRMDGTAIRSNTFITDVSTIWTPQ